MKQQRNWLLFNQLPFNYLTSYLFPCFLVLVLFLFISPFSAEEFDFPVVQNNAFSVGEKIDFKVYFGPVLAGYSTLEVEELTELNKRDCYHVVFETKTNPFFDRFFRVRDLSESWIDTQGIFSWQYKKNLNEGKYHKTLTTIYNYQDKSALVGGKKVEIIPWCQDLLSVYYYLRCLDLKPKAIKRVIVNDGNKNFRVKMEVSEGKEVNYPAGKFSTLYVEPKIEGKNAPPGSGAIWFTNDARKIPVKLKIGMPVGSLTLIAERIKYGE